VVGADTEETGGREGVDAAVLGADLAGEAMCCDGDDEGADTGDAAAGLRGSSSMPRRAMDMGGPVELPLIGAPRGS